MIAIQRISSDDAMSLATDVGAVPLQVGAVLILDGPIDAEQFAQRLAERLPLVPRLRQRLQDVPFGAGRPVWVDHSTFVLTEHFDTRPREPLDRTALYELAVRVICEPLDRARPLWRITLVPELADGRAAVIVAFHHVLADGIGGLAVLASLTDGPTGRAETTTFPAAAPNRSTLVQDALQQRFRGFAHPSAALRRFFDAIVQLRPRRGGRAQRCSLNVPTGARRRLLSVEVPLDHLHRAARAHGATINDVLLTAVGGALGDLLHSRGETVDELVVSIPMSARREATATTLGNEVGAVPIRVPVHGDPLDRLRRVATATTEARRTTRAASTAIIGPLFRVLARLGIFGWFVDHQRLVHTFVTNLRGPDSPLSILGTPIAEVSAVAMITGNVTVSFAALSYAGKMAVTVIVDPDACPDADALAELLHTELTRFCATD